MKKLVLLAIIVMTAACTTVATKGEMTKLDDDVRAQQIKDMNWGMFICWSTSSFSGKEWTRDGHGPEFFKATGCDTDQWCRVAKEAEMGYICFLAKHHDGLCLWDTKTTDKKVTNSPLGIDVLAKLKKSCDKYGLKLALYFSEGDWTYPKGDKSKQAVIKKGQLKELLTQYGPVEFIWMDAAGGRGGVTHEDTVKWVHKFQPNTFVGFNHGPVAGRLRVGESRMAGPMDARSNKYLHNALKSTADNNNWKLAEITYTIFNGRSPAFSGFGNWFYTKAADAGICVSPEFIYRDYLECQKYNTVLDLNVAPDRAGRLRPIDIGVLQQVGRYIRKEDKFDNWLNWDAECKASSEAKGRDFWHRNFGPVNAFDELEQTYWKADEKDTQPTISCTLKKPAEVTGFSVSEPQGMESVKQYRLEAQVNGSWKTIAQGNEIISGMKVKIAAPIKSDKFRLVVDKSSKRVCFSSFKLFY